MSGKSDDDGQLALLDAMVFFAIALVISSSLLGLSRDRSGESDDRWQMPFVESALKAFLGASLGERVILALDGGVVLEPWERVGGCLMAELHSIRDGLPESEFGPLNAVLLSTLDGIVPGPFTYSLLAYEPSSSPEPLLCLSKEGCTATGDRYASSVPMSDQDGAELLLVLELGPAALPEPGGVRA